MGKRSRRTTAFLLVTRVLAVVMAAHAAAGIPSSASRAVQPVIGPGTGGTAFHVGGGCWITARHIAASLVLRIIISGRPTARTCAASTPRRTLLCSSAQTPAHASRSPLEHRNPASPCGRLGSR